MTKPKKIFIAVVVLVVAGYGIYVYRDRIMSVWRSGAGTPGGYQADFQSENGNKNGSQVQSSPTPIGSSIENGAVSPAQKLEEYLKDCDEKCEKRSGDDLKYCLEICGLPTNGKESGEGCDQKTGRDKDACIKSKAIKEKNDQVCDEISDALIKESCVNAVAEDILQ